MSVSLRVDINMKSYQKEFVEKSGALVFSQLQYIFFPWEIGALGSKFASAF